MRVEEYLKNAKPVSIKEIKDNDYVVVDSFDGWAIGKTIHVTKDYAYVCGINYSFDIAIFTVEKYYNFYKLESSEEFEKLARSEFEHQLGCIKEREYDYGKL